jgi:NhaA family Na+:H+ antiporter
MRFFRVEKNVALFVLIFGVLGFLLANTSFEGLLSGIASTRLPSLLIGVDLTVRQWIEDFLLVAFFFLVGLELKRELTEGSLKTPRHLLIPLLSAVLGVAVPAIVYFALTASDTLASRGWAIPTATDLTFGLAVFVLFASKMPRNARTFLLAFAVLDDIIAILIIVFVFGRSISVAWSMAALLGCAAFWFTNSNWFTTRIRFAKWLQVALALCVWYFTFRSGIHPTVSGVALALLVPSRKAEALETRIHPFVGAFVLPIFAFFAAAVPLTNLQQVGMSPVFWAVMLRPLTKFVGISVGAYLGWVILGRHRDASMKLSDYFVVASVGGIGFTVSLLVTNLTWPNGGNYSSAATIATIFSAALSICIAAVTFKLSSRSRSGVSAESTQS